MKNIKPEKILKFMYYVLTVVSIILWFVMMFLPAYVMSLIWFKIVFTVYISSGMIYSILRKKYLPAESISKKGKVILVIMIMLLLIKYLI